MTKVKHAKSSLRRKKKIFKIVKGQVGSRSKLLKTAKEAVRKSLIANYIGRKKKKGDFRSLWITRITAACRAQGTSYNKFMSGMKKTGIALNRKMISDIAANDPEAFKELAEKVKA
ncbi:MAG: 50S ribosomal protein L20 [Candidatus Omnitrophota bacterium]